MFGASSSVGTYAVQLTKRTGLCMFFIRIGIAGESACGFVNSLAADAVLDFRKYQERREDCELTRMSGVHVFTH